MNFYAVMESNSPVREISIGLNLLLPIFVPSISNKIKLIEL